MRRPALIGIGLMLVGGDAAAGHEGLVIVQAHGAAPARVDACRARGPCTEWVHFPLEPRREVVEASTSRTGKHFYVWSKVEHHARDLEIFSSPAGTTAAQRMMQTRPGYGGTLRWLEGERLWHVWGCGTACVSAALYDETGTLFRFDGTTADVAPDAQRLAVADYGGSVEIVDVVSLRRHSSRTHWDTAGFPGEFVWTASGVRVTYGPAMEGGATSDVVVTCTVVTAGGLKCDAAGSNR